MVKKLLADSKPAELLNLIGASAVYVLLLFMPPPPFISQTLNQSGWMILLLMAGIFAILFDQKGGAWVGVQAASVFGLFALLLIYHWQFALSYGEIIGGLLPWSDASVYVQEAQHVLNGILFSSIGGRPLFSGLLAAFLFLTSGNFMVTLALLTWVNALATLLVVREVRRSYGAIEAGIYIVFAYKFYLRFAGTTMTEQLGFALGNLAVFFLLISSQNKSLKLALGGLGLLSLALNARAGAFFILPILVLWIVITYYPKVGLWRSLVPSLVVVALPFLLNSLLLKAIANPGGALFSNYSYYLYGLASGNKGWDQVLRDYPNVTEPEIMYLAVQKIRTDPTLLLKGMAGSYREYFIPLNGAFTFIVYSLYSFRTKANILLWFLTLTGLIHSATNWKGRNFGLILASFIGVFGSLALVPTADTDGMRAYAATIPLTALWVVEGFFALSTWGKKLLKLEEDKIQDGENLSSQKLAIGFSALLIILAIPVPILVRSLNLPSKGITANQGEIACSQGQQSLQGNLLRNIQVVLIPNGASFESYAPFIRIADFQSSLGNNFSDTPPLEQELQDLHAGQQISVGFNLDAGSVWLISSFPVESGRYRACGSESEAQYLRTNNFYTLNGPAVRPLSFSISQQYPNITRLFRLLYGLTVGIIIFLVALNYFRFQQRSLRKSLYLIAAMILILPGIFVALYAQAIIHIPSARQRITLQVKDAVPTKDTYLYSLPLGLNWMNQADLGSSPAVVYEDGIPLASPNSVRQEIKDEGIGRFSVWNGTLLFSSSDNTNPRTNGRKYELEWPHPIRPELQWLAYLVSLLGVAMLVSREWLTRRAGTWLAKLQTRLLFNR